MDFVSYIDIPVLLIVYLLMEGVKTFIFKDKNDKRRNLIPMIALFTGSALALLLYYLWPNVSTSINPLNAFTSGAISGTAATGGNQIYRRATSFFDPSRED